MRLVLDTSVLIDHLRGDPRAVRWLAEAAQRGDELWSVVVVRTEVLAGVRRGEEARTTLLLDALKWQDVTMDIADGAGALGRRFLRSHPGVDTIDYLIAAAAQVLGADLVTCNVRHFPMFVGLKAPYR